MLFAVDKNPPTNRLVRGRSPLFTYQIISLLFKLCRTQIYALLRFSSKTYSFSSDSVDSENSGTETDGLSSGSGLGLGLGLGVGIGLGVVS